MIKETTTFISTPFQYTTISIIWIIPAEIRRGEIGGGGKGVGRGRGGGGWGRWRGTEGWRGRGREGGRQGGTEGEEGGGGEQGRAGRRRGGEGGGGEGRWVCMYKKHFTLLPRIF